MRDFVELKEQGIRERESKIKQAEDLTSNFCQIIKKDPAEWQRFCEETTTRTSHDYAVHGQIVSIEWYIELLSTFCGFDRAMNPTFDLDVAQTTMDHYAMRQCLDHELLLKAAAVHMADDAYMDWNKSDWHIFLLNKMFSNNNMSNQERDWLIISLQLEYKTWQ